MEHVFGYTVAHDVTARDWVSKNGGPWLLAKTFDTFLPLGPAIVTRDSISGLLFCLFSFSASYYTINVILMPESSAMRNLTNKHEIREKRV